jgi:hypothetical protein
MPSSSSKHKLPWAAVTVVAVVIETEALRNKKQEATLSQVTRDVFMTHTRPGRAAFLIAWSWLAVWYGRHILKAPR